MNGAASPCCSTLHSLRLLGRHPGSGPSLAGDNAAALHRGAGPGGATGTKACPSKPNQEKVVNMKALPGAHRPLDPYCPRRRLRRPLSPAGHRFRRALAARPRARGQPPRVCRRPCSCRDCSAARRPARLSWSRRATLIHKAPGASWSNSRASVICHRSSAHRYRDTR